MLRSREKKRNTKRMLHSSKLVPNMGFFWIKQSIRNASEHSSRYLALTICIDRSFINLLKLDSSLKAAINEAWMLKS